MKNIATVLWVFLLVSCSEKSGNEGVNQNKEQFRDATTILATVNKVEITDNHFNLYKRALAISEPNLTDSQILDKLIEFELVSQKAKQEGYDERADIKARIHLQANELLSDIYIKQLIASASDEVLLMAEYERLKNENGSVEILLRHIMADTEAEIRRLREQIQISTFEQVANIHNQNNLGGVVGWVTPAEMIEPIRNVLTNLPENTLSTIIESQYGFHLIMIDSKRPTEFLPYETAKKDIRSTVVMRKMTETIAALKKNADIKIFANFEKTP